MGELTNSERQAAEQASAAPMLAQVEAWAVINSGTGNLSGLKALASMVANEFSALPGDLKLEDAKPFETIEPDGSARSSMAKTST